MAETYNFDFFQIPSVGIVENYVGDGAQQHRDYSQKMSNFGALNYGLHMTYATISGVSVTPEPGTTDYTRVAYGFKAKDELQNPTVPPFVMDSDYNKNPFVWGSTVKRIRNDEFTVMGLGSRRDMEADLPGFDVSDRKASDGPFEAPKSFPSEGWHSFGGRIAGPANYITPGHQAV